MALAPGGAPKTQGPAAAWQGRGGDTRAALSLVPGPTRAAPSQQTPAQVVRAAGGSSRQQRRLETEAAVVKSTCSISHLHRAT